MSFLKEALLIPAGLFFYLVLTSQTVLANTDKSSLPQGFVYLSDIIPGIETDIRYFSNDNFVGQRISGYLQPKAILSEKAATALAKVQKDLLTFGFGLKVYDAYRPQRAVDHFVRWAKDLSDTKMKAQYYPAVKKINLFTDGYIAAKSGHSRGSTLDVTLISTVGEKTIELDMGTHWDYFSLKSWSKHLALTPGQRANRMLLQQVMTKHGFDFLKEEWWHFTLKDEAFPRQYFDFIIQ